MKQILLFLTSLFFISSLNAQQIVDGFVVTNEGDTLSGTIFKPSNTENYFRINFFRNGDPNNGSQYTPNEIFGYGIQGQEFFKSHKILEENTSIEAQYVFLKILIDNGGELSLFAFKNDADSEFFFIKKRVGSPVLLTKSNYQKVIVEEFIYDCNEGSFQKKYTSAYLSRLVLDYNTCKDPNYEEDLTYISNGLYKIGLSFGTGMGPIFLKNYPFDSPDLLSSVSIESFKNKEFSITLNLGFEKRSLSYRYEEQGVSSLYGSGSIKPIETTTSYYFNSLFGSLKFNKYSTDGLYFFVGAGITYNLDSSSGDLEIVTTDKSFLNQYSKSELTATNEINYRLSNTSFFAGFGKTIKNYQFELRINYMNLNAENRFESASPTGGDKKITIYDKNVVYKISYPKLPKFAIDFTITIPLIIF